MSSQPKKSSADIANDLINKLGGKVYGEAEATKAVSISVSLPPAMLQALEDRRNANKKAKLGRRTISGLIQEALEEKGY